VEFGGSKPAVDVSSGVAVERRTAHDIDLELQRVKLDLQRIELEDGDVEAYCVELADGDPELFAWLVVEHCPEEMREAMIDVLQDRPELLITVH
jgi:hypothetical protein